MKQLNAKHTRRTKTHSDCVVIDTGSIFDYHFHIPCYLHGTPRYLKIPWYDHSTLPKKGTTTIGLHVQKQNNTIVQKYSITMVRVIKA